MPTSSDDDGVCSAIRAGVLQHLPPTIQPFWLDLEMIHTILKRGGYPMLPFDAVVNAMKGGRSSGVPALDRFHQNGGHSRTYYKFSSIFEGYKCYKDQRDAWVMIPRVHPKWFVKHKSNFLGFGSSWIIGTDSDRIIQLQHSNSLWIGYGYYPVLYIYSNMYIYLYMLFRSYEPAMPCLFHLNAYSTV